jgi:hypothetical protein
LFKVRSLIPLKTGPAVHTESSWECTRYPCQSGALDHLEIKVNKLAWLSIFSLYLPDDFGRDTEDDDIIRDIFINETKSPNY